MKWSEGVQAILKQFYVEDNVLMKISEDMQAEFALGLERGSPASSVAMLPSYVPQLPDGTETGKYVAIDLSGKNLRLVLLTLVGKGVEPEVITHNYMVHESVMKGTGEQLFNFIVNCLQKFLSELNLLDANLPVGFVFSYPCELHSIRSARLLWWTKGFDIKDCLQKDVVLLLEHALEMNNSIKARIKAVMNDTVGQLAAAAYKYGPECCVAVVIGYGCNSSYLEETAKIKKFNASKADYNHKHMVIVTEWEEFGAQVRFFTLLHFSAKY
uniref:Phosphotransferase n=1 Tax=Plectus sambesii TaxID=2011161 RepID=A0A914X5J5_9BILA